MSEEVAQANADRAEIARLRAELEQVQSDYAMLRGAVRLIFGEQPTDVSLRDLWNLVTTVEHPGAAMNIRFNKLKAELTTVSTAAHRAASHLPGRPDLAEQILSEVLKGATTL